MTAAPEPGPEAGSRSADVQWTFSRDYSADWPESRFLEHWASQATNPQPDRTPPMCSLCGCFMQPARPSSHDTEHHYSDHEMNDNFRSNRFDGIVDQDDNDDDDIDEDDRDGGAERSEEGSDESRDEEDENDGEYDRDESDDDSDEDEDDDDDDDANIGLSSTVVFQLFMNRSGIFLPSSGYEDQLDDDMFELVETHMREAHGAPDDYCLDDKDFLPPLPNPLIYPSTRVPMPLTASATLSADDVLDEISELLSELKVGAVPRKTMHGWVKVLAQGLGRDTRGLQVSLGQLLHLCYELQWRKTIRSAS